MDTIIAMPIKRQPQIIESPVFPSVTILFSKSEQRDAPKIFKAIITITRYAAEYMNISTRLLIIFHICTLIFCQIINKIIKGGGEEEISHLNMFWRANRSRREI